jgi:hypothetical protein
MSLSQQAGKIVRKSKGDVGGTTYFILLSGAKESKPLCYRKIHNSIEHCGNPAGFRTDHLRTGACFLHGGANTSSIVLVNGRTATSMRKALQNRVNDYLLKNRDNLLDLTYELATARAIYDEFVEIMPDPEDDTYGTAIYRFINLLSAVSNLVEKMSKTESRNTLTTAQVMYLRVTMVDIFVKYISDPFQRERAARELAKRLGGDIEAELLPAEV